MSTTITLFDVTKPVEQVLASNQTWSHNIGTTYPALLPALGKGQSPEILWLGCSDSRVPETMLLGLNPGDVFVHRNIANLVNPNDTSFPAVVEYAVDELKANGVPTIKHIILCGHIGCGGAKASLTGVLGDPTAASTAPTLVGIPEIDNWIAPLKALIHDHPSMFTGQTWAAQQLAIVKLNIQRGLATIRAIPVVAEAFASRQLLCHGAIYDVGTGLISFLEGADEIEPPVELTPIGVGHFSTTELHPGAQTTTVKEVVFSKPYSKPPRIFLGLTSVDVTVHQDNPRMYLQADKVTTTGYELTVTTWGSSQLNSASCTWLEIPDDDAHSLVQTGSFATSDIHPWYQPALYTPQKITFTKPYTAPPKIVVWIWKFDLPQNPAALIKAYATEITTTGFTINIDGGAGFQLYQAAVHWLAYDPADTNAIQTSGSFGFDGGLNINLPPNCVRPIAATGTLALPVSQSPATVVAGLRDIFWTAGDAMRVSTSVAAPVGTTAQWTIATSGNTQMYSCSADYVVLPGVNKAFQPAPPGADL